MVAERGSCAVREPLYAHLFNLSALFNATSDHFVAGAAAGLRFVLNVCGPLVSDCNPFDRSTVCLVEEEGSSLSYEDGSLSLDYGSHRERERDDSP